MKKRVNEQALLDELRDGSVFFQRPTPLSEPPALTPPPPEAPVPPQEQPYQTLPGRPNDRPDDGGLRTAPPVGPSGRRIIHRHPFEVFTDQVARLKKLAYEEALAGGNGSMSRMVRDAIDAYLQQHERQEHND